MRGKALVSCKKPIIFFTESSKNIGGQELQLLQQMKELKKRNIHPILICNQEGRIYQTAKERMFMVIPIGFRNSLDLCSITKMVYALRRHKPIAVISHSGHDAVVSALAIKLSNFFFGTTLKLVRMKTYQSKTPSIFSINKMCDVMCTPSNFLRNEIINGRDFLGSKIHVLYPGVAFSELDASADINLPHHLVEWLSVRPGPIILQGAMLRPEKGHELIIAALPAVLAIHKNVRYVIAGEGEEKLRLETLVGRLNLGDHVYFAGMVSPISALLKRSTLAVLPSLREPLGMFQIESQYLCIPTLAHKIDGIVETMLDRKTGLLIDISLKDVWAENMIWALDNLDQMQEWALHGRKFVSERFSLNKNIEALLKVIDA